ncbi:MAG: hypothetical protein J4G15_00960 [Alphaproteobacteria bacterium]|nr:hypothetical protein [Alphaproteobacteria bacterium]
MEATLAGSGILKHMTAARRADYRVVLHYVSVGSPDQALDRIRNRVTLGGHDVPEAAVRRRFARSHANLPAAMARADLTVLLRQRRSRPAVPGGCDLRDGTRWITRDVPGWAEVALARTGRPYRR